MSAAAALIAARYGGAVASRALWIWAGGDPADVPLADAPEARWAALWARADRDDPPTRIGLLRQVLLDDPGDAAVLEVLSRTAEAVSPGSAAGGAGAADVVVGWESGLDAAALAAALGAGLADDADLAFAVLAPPLQNRLGPQRRAELCGLADAAATASGAALRDALHGTLADPDADEEGDQDDGQGEEAAG